MSERKDNNVNLNSEMEEVCLQIIALAGDAKSKVYEALSTAQDGQFSKAKQMLEEANRNIHEAREIQHVLLTKEARGTSVTPSVLLNHAMDILITAESERNLAVYVLGLFESVLQSS
jgi:cellobiose-specific phosphotransferase system component IIA